MLSSNLGSAPYELEFRSCGSNLVILGPKGVYGIPTKKKKKNERKKRVYDMSIGEDDAPRPTKKKKNGTTTMHRGNINYIVLRNP